MKILNPNRVIRLRNLGCPYCGSQLNGQSKSEDHTVGRRFVPKGTLENQWNLIVYACRDCNAEKANLEDDISAITMQPDVLGRMHGIHPQLATDAKHKAPLSISRRTKKPVIDSKSRININLKLEPGMNFKLNFVGPAEIAEERAYQLALRQFQAFFYFITYDETSQRGWCWKGFYAPIQATWKNDWGNEQALSYIKITEGWLWRFHGVTAGEHFKIAIRKNPTQDIWSLAVEWNESYRVLAVAGEDELLRQFFSQLATPNWSPVMQGLDSTIRVRTEIPINEADDTLFSCNTQITNSQ